MLFRSLGRYSTLITPKVGSLFHAAFHWKNDRRSCARIEATAKGLDIRFVVTSIETGSAEHIYQRPYCARGQAENPGLRRGRL